MASIGMEELTFGQTDMFLENALLPKTSRLSEKLVVAGADG